MTNAKDEYRVEPAVLARLKAATPSSKMENENLRTASLYINNQLLSRGLLRDGQQIDFVNSGREHGGATATMTKIMTVLNDLILRRDVSIIPLLGANIKDVDNVAA